MTAYAILETRFARMQTLGQVSALLGWDSATCLPDGAADLRGEQMALLAGLRHEWINDPALHDLLGEAEQETLEPWQKANLFQMRRDWVHATCLPERLVTEMAALTTEAEHAWRACRANNDFPGFRPYLERIVALTKETAAAKGAVLGLSPYDALLDSFSPGLLQADIDPLFDDLRGFLPDAIEGAILKQGLRCPDVPESIPTERQQALARELMQWLGFDFHHGRLDTSTHPFCGGVPGDIRITTRYDEHNFMEAILGVLHETGHALYEANLPTAWRAQPVGQALGMALHESQSLFVEMQVSRSLAFFRFATPLMQGTLGLAEDALDAESLYRRATFVRRSLIRVSADEVTYPTHVILRYELEKALLSGELAVADLPGAWAEGQQKLLGIRPENDTTGCLQDIHWPGGAFGYFPSYTVGATIAAQLREAMERRLGPLDPLIEAGSFAPILGWLKEEIHGKASLLPMQELLRQATGQGLSSAAYKRHITRRYLDE